MPGSSKNGYSVEDKALAALKNLRSIGIEEPSKQLIMTMAGSSSMTSFKVLMGKSRKKNYITFPGKDTIAITDAGLAAAPEGIVDDVPGTDEQLQDRIKSFFKLSSTGVPGKIFDYLRGGPRTKQEIAKHVGYEDESNTSFKVLLGKLTSKKLAIKTEDGKRLELSSMCFLRS